MNSTLRKVRAVATRIAVGGVIVACGPAAVVTPPASAPTAVATTAPASAPTAVASPSAPGNPSPQAAHLTVGGSDVGGSPLGLTVKLPADWQPFDNGADIGTSAPPAGMAFVVSVVDDTFSDPCAHIERDPKVGPTIADLAKALTEIPNTTATAPVLTTIAGHQATYVEISIPASLPCAPSEFYLWQDSPHAYWWVQGLNETARVWILEVAGLRVAFLTHAYPGSGADPKTRFQQILDSAVFDNAATGSSASPTAP